MADISTLLAQAAITPTRGPDIDGALRKTRRGRAAVRLAATALLGAAIVLPAYWIFRSKPTQRLHVAGTSTVTTSLPRPPFEFRDGTHRFSIEIPARWFRSEQPLEPWLHSPHEILSIATVPVSPSPLPGNQAACPSEIPKVAVDAIGRDGAYLGIYEWIRGEGLYGTEPRPDHAALLHWVRECPLPNGIAAFGATFTDGNRDFTVHMVLGADARSLRAEIYAALDSFRPDARSAATTAPTASRP
jgi:hypothetical protein